MTDPRVLTVFSVVFILLGAYSVRTGMLRLKDARAHDHPIPWYKQINLLTGIEYMLLALVFLISIGTRTGTLPNSLQSIVFPLYILLLIAAAVLAGLVIRQGISNARRTSSRQSPQTVQNNGTSRAAQEASVTGRKRTAPIDRRRERRKNAAAARRRRAGKA